MSLGKKDISNNIFSKTHLSSKESLEFVDTFLKIIKSNKNINIKLSNFGSFSLIKTPKRIGRNPKTKEIYEIKARKKLRFIPSSKVKLILN